jgi:hypothetical protein
VRLEKVNVFVDAEMKTFMNLIAEQLLFFRTVERRETLETISDDVRNHKMAVSAEGS